MRALAALVALVAGGWLLGAVVAPGPLSATLAIAAWFVLVGRLARHDRAARTVVRAGAVVAVATLLWTGRETTVDERVPVGAPAPAEAVDDLLAPQS